MVRTNLFIPSRFWTTCTNFDTCCVRNIATCGKKYRCTSTFSALNYCGGIFFKSLSCLYEVDSGAHNVFDGFGLFEIFDRNF